MPIVATLLAERLLGLDWRSVARRGGAALVALAVVVLGQVGLNAVNLQRPAMAPLGPLFVFARLNEDGLIQPWLIRHCAVGGPAELCVIAPRLPKNSQQLLCGGAATPVSDLIWHADPLYDECPRGCHHRSGGIAFALTKFRPGALAALDELRQVMDHNPKAA